MKEVLERLQVTGSERATWPVLELEGRIVWMKGVELEPEPGIAVIAEFIDAGTGLISPSTTFELGVVPYRACKL